MLSYLESYKKPLFLYYQPKQAGYATKLYIFKNPSETWICKCTKFQKRINILQDKRNWWLMENYENKKNLSWTRFRRMHRKLLTHSPWPWGGFYDSLKFWAISARVSLPHPPPLSHAASLNAQSWHMKGWRQGKSWERAQRSTWTLPQAQGKYPPKAEAGREPKELDWSRQAKLSITERLVTEQESWERKTIVG